MKWSMHNYLMQLCMSTPHFFFLNFSGILGTLTAAGRATKRPPTTPMLITLHSALLSFSTINITGSDTFADPDVEYVTTQTYIGESVSRQTNPSKVWVVDV